MINRAISAGNVLPGGTRESPWANPGNRWWPKHNHLPCEIGELYFACGLLCCSSAHRLVVTSTLEAQRQIRTEALTVRVPSPQTSTLTVINNHAAFLTSIAATRSLQPDPHWDTILTACVKGTFSGCTRSGLTLLDHRISVCDHRHQPDKKYLGSFRTLQVIFEP